MRKINAPDFYFALFPVSSGARRLHNIVVPHAALQAAPGTPSPGADRVQTVQADFYVKAEADQILDDRRSPTVSKIAQNRLIYQRMHSLFRHSSPQIRPNDG